VLETSRLVLRSLLPSNAAELAALDADPEVFRYLETPSHVDRPGCLALVSKATGDFLGWAELTPEGSLGYRLHRRAWGNGYATEAARALIARKFTESALDRVYATTMSVNTRSRSVLAKSGLRHTRTFWAAWPDLLPGAEFGDVEYELRRHDWARAQNTAG
jgi:RimJ/RimL family protein N-acetyltransferase